MLSKLKGRFSSYCQAFLLPTPWKRNSEPAEEQLTARFAAILVSPRAAFVIHGAPELTLAHEYESPCSPCSSPQSAAC